MMESKPSAAQVSPGKKKKQLEEKRASALKSSLRSSRRDMDEEAKYGKEMASMGGAQLKSRANNNVFT